MKFLKTAYWNSIAPFTVFFLVSVICLLSYRIQVFFLIRCIHQDFSELYLHQYLSWCFPQDAFILSCLALILLIFFTFFVSWVKFKSVLSSVFLFTESCLLVLAIDFFKFYETSFQKSYLASEVFTNSIGNMIKSVMAEISVSGYFQMGFYLVVSIGIGVLIFRISKNQFFSHLHQPSKKFALIPIFIVIPFFIGALFFMFQEKKVFKEKKASLAQEFSINPILEFLSKEKAHGQLACELKINKDRQKDFSNPFDTTSIENKGHVPTMNWIPKGKKYNIILYAFESTSYQYLRTKINGEWVMRTWNRLEKNSIHFEKHYAHYPLSANALFSVITSTYDPNSKESGIERYPNLLIKTLPEVLKENGYRTALIHTGFLEYARQIDFLKHRKFDLMLEFKDLIKTPGFTQTVGWGADERTMIEPAVQFIKNNGREPFFLAMFPVNPHHPYSIPGKEYQITGELPTHWNEKTKSWKKYLNSLYFADAALGEFIDRLEKEGLMENTILVLYADHGEAFYQHPMNYNHPFFIYEENVHVPFLIYSKDFLKESHSYSSVSRHIDIAPTILDILGISSPREYEGIPLLKAHREQMAILHASWKDDYRGIRDGKWKYIRKTFHGTEELYDLEKDPAEKNNLAVQYPEISERYRYKTEEGSNYKDQFFQVFYDSKKLIQAKQK